MITIRQHAPDGSLNDVSRFLLDIDSFFVVDSWEVGHLELIGTNALDVERYFGKKRLVSNSELRELFDGIHQTIWGCFSLFSEGRLVAELETIESSCWEIESEEDSFLSYMLQKYGAYEGFGGEG